MSTSINDFHEAEQGSVGSVDMQEETLVASSSAFFYGSSNPRPSNHWLLAAACFLSYAFPSGLPILMVTAISFKAGHTHCHTRLDTCME